MITSELCRDNNLERSVLERTLWQDFGLFTSIIGGVLFLQKLRIWRSWLQNYITAFGSHVLRSVMSWDSSAWHIDWTSSKITLQLKLVIYFNISLEAALKLTSGFLREQKQSAGEEARNPSHRKTTLSFNIVNLKKSTPVENWDTEKSIRKIDHGCYIQDHLKRDQEETGNTFKLLYPKRYPLCTSYPECCEYQKWTKFLVIKIDERSTRKFWRRNLQSMNFDRLKRNTSGRWQKVNLYIRFECEGTFILTLERMLVFIWNFKNRTSVALWKPIIEMSKK